MKGEIVDIQMNIDKKIRIEPLNNNVTKAGFNIECKISQYSVTKHITIELETLRSDHLKQRVLKLDDAIIFLVLL